MKSRIKQRNKTTNLIISAEFNYFKKSFTIFHKPSPETIRMISTPKVFCLRLLANFFIFWRLLSTISRNMEATGRTNPLATWANTMTERGLKLKAALKQAAISPARMTPSQIPLKPLDL